MYKLIISVTQDVLMQTAHCPKGSDAGDSCAIAVAVRDIFPKAFVDNYKIWVYGTRKNSTSLIPLPIEAKRFILKFDQRSPKARIKMSPISFEIEIPDKVIKRINIGEIKLLLNNHPTLELV